MAGIRPYMKRRMPSCVAGMVRIGLQLSVACHVCLSSSLRSSNAGLVLGLRGGGWIPARGVKRGRDEDWQPADFSSNRLVESGLETHDAPPPAKIHRSGWNWNVWRKPQSGQDDELDSTSVGSQNILHAMVSSASSALMRIFSWKGGQQSSDKSSTHDTGRSYRASNHSKRVIFSGDEDKPTAIQRQIAFYFSDSNLPSDKFLKAEIAKNPEGYVDLGIIAKFQRMRTLNASVDDIAAAARNVEFLSVSDDGLRVRRTSAVPEEDISLDRTVYATPFRTDSIGQVMEQIPGWFEPYGRVKSVRMLRDFRNERDFTGAAFIEFESNEEAHRCTRMPIEVEGVTLEICMKRDWKRSARMSNRLSMDGDDDVRPRKPKNRTVVVKPHVGVFVKVDGLFSNVTRHDVESVMVRYGKIKFVEMVKPANSTRCRAVVRFERHSFAKTAVKDCTEGEAVCISGSFPNVTLIEGIEEEREQDKLSRRTQVLNRKVPFWKKKKMRG